MPSKKRKQTVKKKTQSKRKAVTREKKISKAIIVKINRSDPLYLKLKAKYSNRHVARARVQAIGLPYRKIEGNKSTIAQRNLIDAIYLETKKKIKIQKNKDIEGVEVVNILEGSIITIKDERGDDLIVITDQNPDYVKSVRVDSEPDSGIIAVQSDTLANEKLTTQVQILPTVQKQIESQEQFKKDSDFEKDTTKKDVQAAFKAKQDNKYSQLAGNLLIPTLVEPPGKDFLKRNRKRLLKYAKKGWIPFYYPDTSKQPIELSRFKNLPKVDYLIEKELLIPKGIKKDQYLVTTGQHIQTQVHEIPFGSGEFDWVGLYFQKKSKAKLVDPIPHIVRAKQIRADDDDTGHFLAYINNMYAFNNPMKRNFKVEGNKVLIKPDEFRAMRFLAKSIINSMARKRNLALEDAILKVLGERALKYRTDAGSETLVVSEQLVEIVKLAQDQTIVASVNVADRTPIDFKVDFKEWNEAKPIIRFIEVGEIDKKTGKIAVHKLDSDSLLKIIVRKFNIDMVSAQRMLESLHNQDWITYPRIDVQRAEDVPIRIHGGKKGKKFKALEALINKSGKSSAKTAPGEQLTVQEFEVLRIVYEAEKASDQKENYVKRGYWEMKSGDLILRTNDNILASEPQSYDAKLFDIQIKKKTLDENEMLDYLVENNVGTPATRSGQIERLRNAGVLTFRDGNYVIDRRGYYMVAAHNVMGNANVPFVTKLFGEIDQVEEKDFQSLNRIVNSFEFINRHELAKATKKEAKKLIEAEHDLTYLDSF